MRTNGNKILEWQLNIRCHRKSRNCIVRIDLIITFNRSTSAAVSFRYLTTVGVYIFSSPSSSTQIHPPRNPALSHHRRDTHNTYINMYNVFCEIQVSNTLRPSPARHRLVPVHIADSDLGARVCAFHNIVYGGVVDFEASIRKLCSRKLLLPPRRRCSRGG